MKLSADDLLQICNEYRGHTYHVAGEIPEKKLVNAAKHFPIPSMEGVAALIDSTAFGSCKYGLAIGQSGIYWRNPHTAMSMIFRLPWKEFASVPIVGKGFFSKRVEMGEGY